MVDRGRPRDPAPEPAGSGCREHPHHAEGVAPCGAGAGSPPVCNVARSCIAPVRELPGTRDGRVDSGPSGHGVLACHPVPPHCGCDVAQGHNLRE
ncbi:hypothetical protein GCM10023403_06330 [Pseudonocardia benzenivorans]|nr:hypothetical protein PSD17_68760 [Pseudonocardia sp. D17]